MGAEKAAGSVRSKSRLQFTSGTRRTANKVSGNSVTITHPHRGGVFRVQTTTVQCSTRTSVGRCAWITLSESHGGLTGQLAISTIRRTYRRTDASCGVHVSRDPSRGPFLERDWRLSCLSFLCLYISTQLQPAALRPSFRRRAPPARPARIRVTGATGACSSAEARARDVVVANE